MVGVFSIAFIGKSFSSGPGNHVVACLRTVIAASLAVHVVILQFRPPVLEFLAPETPSPHARVAPGKVVVVETVILIRGHPIPDLRVFGKFPVQAAANLEQFRRPGDVHVFRSANRDCFQPFVWIVDH